MKPWLTLLFYFTLSSAYAGQIGIVSLDKIIFKLNDYKQIDIEVNKIILEKNKRLDLFDEEIAKEQKKISSGILVKEKIDESARLIQAIQLRKQTYMEQAQVAVDQQEAILRKPLVKKTLLYIKEYAKKHNFDLIIEKNSVILEQNKQLVDISQSVLKELNSK